MKVTVVYTKAEIEKHREYGAQGGKKAARGMTKAERTERARKASEARWGGREDTLEDYEIRQQVERLAEKQGKKRVAQ